MLKLARYVKPFILLLIFAIALLAAQAWGELTLPEHMSKVVDIGLSRGGIDSLLPDAFRESEYQKLKLLLDEDTKLLFEQGYTFVSAENNKLADYPSYLKKYPALETESAYILTAQDNALRDELESELAVAMVMMYAIENRDAAESFTSSSGFDMSMFPEGADPFDVFAAMPPEELASMLTDAEDLLSALPEAALTQLVSSYIKQEYTVMGADIKALQNNYIYKEAGQMLLIAGIILVVIIIESFLASKIGAGLGKSLRAAVFRKVVNFSSAEFDKFSTASLITRTTNDVQQIQMMIPILLRIAVYSPILAIGGVIKVLNSDASMAWIVALGAGIIIAVVVTVFIIVFPKFKIFQKLMDKMNLILRESLIGMLVIRAFSNQGYEEKRFLEPNRDILKLNLFIGKVFSVLMPIMMFTMNGISILIVWVGSRYVDAGSLQIGTMMTFLQYSMQILGAFLMMTMIMMILPRASVSAGRIFEVLNSNISIKDPQMPKDFAASKNGIVEFKNVSFKYPGAEENVLHDISFVAKPGETTAIIGSTGSGKSTIINLIPRFYDTSAGEVIVEGVNIKDVKLSKLRDRIGYIPQKALLFSGSIESNIKYSDENLTDELMEKAAAISQSEEFINAKEDKYHEPISQGGTNVSGGQKQRLSIARALAKNPQILLFDDSFSALDYKTDRKLRAALDKEMANKTVIIVAQRIGTIKNADKILVIDEGEIVGEGSHRYLLDNCEVYKQIALSQLSEEELKNEC